MKTVNIPFINDYFLKDNILHRPGECLDEKAWILPFSLAKDFKETRCKLEVKDMEFIRGGELIKDISKISFCKNCIK